MASLARYFRQKVLDNVRADVDLVVRRVAGPEDDAPPPNKRARKEAAPGGVPGDPLQLTKFPAHNIILNASEYLKVQQVRVLVPWHGLAERLESGAAVGSICSCWTVPI
jgi:hypothetical protein